MVNGLKRWERQCGHTCCVRAVVASAAERDCTKARTASLGRPSASREGTVANGGYTPEYRPLRSTMMT